MQTRDVVGFVLVPLVMLLAMLFADIARLTSEPVVDPAVLWFLRMVAYALLVVGGTALICQAPPAEVRVNAVLMVWLGSVVLMVGKFLWDIYLPFEGKPGQIRLAPSQRPDVDLYWLRFPDLIGFNVVLLAAFLIARATKRSQKSTRPGPSPRPPEAETGADVRPDPTPSA